MPRNLSLRYRIYHFLGTGNLHYGRVLPLFVAVVTSETELNRAKCVILGSQNIPQCIVLRRPAMLVP